MRQRSAFAFLLVLMLCTLAALPIRAQAGDAGEPSLMLANVYDGPVDLRDYWVSEKLDGVRAYWDGQRFLSRQGNVYIAPDWFTSGFPEFPLDGELWMGRGTFETLVGAVRRHDPDDALWKKIRFMVFDMPDAPGTFDHRLQALKTNLLDHSSPYLRLVHQFKVEGPAQLRRKLDAAVAAGAEGLMLHRGTSRYRGIRSDDLLKLKKYQDAEAVVIEHLPGNGKYTDMLGSVLVETSGDLRFRIGTGFTDEERRNPPPLGSVITYKFYGRTENGIPRFASFLRVRADEPVQARDSAILPAEISRSESESVLPPVSGSTVEAVVAP